MKQGCVQVYTGDGKGKTTASVGLAVRALGAGLRVFIGQFIKGSDSSEMALLRSFGNGIAIEQFGLGRFVKGTPSPEDLVAAAAGLVRLQEVLESGAYDVVVADEINGAVGAGLLDVDQVVALVERRPAGVELVLTGRGADPRILALADLVTEMRKVKHCFDAGVPARLGIEM